MAMNMQQMMKQAQKMQRDLAEAQERVKEMTIETTAGGGMVRVVARGDMTIESITINPVAVDPEETEMLEDMVLAAVNEGLRAVAAQNEAAIAQVTGGMSIPGLM